MAFTKGRAIGGAALVVAASAMAQDAPIWKIGDHVEARNPSTTNWDPARVIGIEDWRKYGKGFAYRIEVDDKTAAITVWNATPDLIRPFAGASAPMAFKAGDRVDVFYDATHGKNRGTILEVGAGKYKVHYDGCTPNWDEWVDRLAVRVPATLAAGAAEVAYLIGRWAMFTPSYPNTVVRGEDVYREYGPGAKSPPLEIKADGTFVWHYDYGHPPSTGRWTPDAKVEGADMGTQAYAGVVIADPAGRPWKVYKIKSLVDAQDRIEARLMCSGETDIGTRIR